MTDRESLEQVIATLEAQRQSLGDATVDAALESLRRQLADLEPADEISRQALMGERLSMPQSRPMPNIGQACHELRIRDKEKNLEDN